MLSLDSLCDMLKLVISIRVFGALASLAVRSTAEAGGFQLLSDVFVIHSNAIRLQRTRPTCRSIAKGTDDPAGIQFHPSFRALSPIQIICRCATSARFLLDVDDSVEADSDPRVHLPLLIVRSEMPVAFAPTKNPPFLRESDLLATPRRRPRPSAY